VTKPSLEIDDLKHFAIEVINRLGEKAFTYYGRGDTRLKFDQSLVTEAEVQLTELFQEQLRGNFPDHQVLTSSLRPRDYTHEGKRYLWIHDPVEGVANFQAGIPIWGISLALLENFWPIFGVFHMPATGDTFHAQAGQKAFRGKEEIHVSTQEDINDESLLLTYSRFHKHYSSTFPGKIRDLGCTVAHLCYVAMGRAEAAVIANESYSDLAAVRVILEAAGGKIFKMDGSEVFLNEYLDEQKIEEHLLVVSPDNYSQVRNHLRELS